MGFSKAETSILISNFFSFGSYMLLQAGFINLFVYSLFMIFAAILGLYSGIVGGNRGLAISQIPWIIANSFIIVKYLSDAI